MAKQVLFIEAEREGYGVDQIHKTMTVAELMACLEQFDDDTPVYLRHDRGYTYGGITESKMAEMQMNSKGRLFDMDEECEEDEEDEGNG